MTVRTCDKCGLEINTNPMVNAILHRKKGRWIKSTKSLWPLGTCSECGYISVEAEKANFCPNCGARMEEE